MRASPWSRLALWLLLPLPLGAAGCAGMTLRPRALDEAARVRDLGLAFGPDGSGSLTLALEVDNPTWWDASVRGVDFELWLDGRRYAVGTRGASLLLGSGGRSSLNVAFPLRSEPTRDVGPPHVWRVEVRGGVALAFGETVRLLPFRTARDLKLPYFRPVEPEAE